MGLGTAVRTRLGRWEVPAAELYRSAFINLDDLAVTLASLVPARRILEIGCGDGSMADRLCTVYPEAEYVGIDISDDPGRLFRGDRSRAEFRTMYSSDLVAEQGAPFDLVAIVDVVHHVAEDMRASVLQDAAALTGPDGVIALKEWERGRGVPHLLAFTSDRYISGDRTVRFMAADELGTLMRASLPGFDSFGVVRVPPHRNNVLHLLRRTASEAP